MKFTWTKPYCGVQHLQQHVVGIRQITLTDYGGGVVVVWALPMEGFTEIWKADTATVEDAMQAAEEFAGKFDVRGGN